MGNIKLKWLVLMLVSSLSILLWHYFQPLKDTVFTWLIQQDKSKSQALIGQYVDRYLLVTPFASTQPHPLTELLPDTHLLVIYASWCEPCKSLLHTYQSQATPLTPPLYVLSFNQADIPPVGFPTERFLLADTRRADSIFAGLSYPVLWHFSQNGQVIDVITGYDEIIFHEWLEQFQQTALIHSEASH
ncbi:hypothetical protein [Arsukibacterium sp.]|uniref:hypothetical protein n=1 Tax=Arsukibacterium sp. TaxID=1977258 RepID=UPI002FDAF5C5